MTRYLLARAAFRGAFAAVLVAVAGAYAYVFSKAPAQPANAHAVTDAAAAFFAALAFIASFIGAHIAFKRPTGWADYNHQALKEQHHLIRLVRLLRRQKRRDKYKLVDNDKIVIVPADGDRVVACIYPTLGDIVLAFLPFAVRGDTSYAKVSIRYTTENASVTYESAELYYFGGGDVTNADLSGLRKRLENALDPPGL